MQHAAAGHIMRDPGLDCTDFYDPSFSRNRPRVAGFSLRGAPIPGFGVGLWMETDAPWPVALRQSDRTGRRVVARAWEAKGPSHTSQVTPRIVSIFPQRASMLPK